MVCKRNSLGATVEGMTVEFRANYDRKMQIESGFTLQSSRFDESVEYIEGIEGLRAFTRTPNTYGFANLSITPNNKINANINYIYTGSMLVPHFAGAPNQLVDEIVTSEAFSEFSLKLGYTIQPKKQQSAIKLYGGVRNLFNAFQDEFDIGKIGIATSFLDQRFHEHST